MLHKLLALFCTLMIVGVPGVGRVVVFGDDGHLHLISTASDCHAHGHDHGEHHEHEPARDVLAGVDTSDWAASPEDSPAVRGSEHDHDARWSESPLRSQQRGLATQVLATLAFASSAPAWTWSEFMDVAPPLSFAPVAGAMPLAVHHAHSVAASVVRLT